MKKVIFTLLLASSLLVNAQEKEEKSFTLSGSVDTYFRGNISGGNYDTAPGSSFANQPGFALGMINLVAGYEGEKVGFVADMVYGPRGADAVFGSQQELADAIGVSRKTISTVETGRFTPSVVIALRIAAHFAIPVEQVFELK